MITWMQTHKKWLIITIWIATIAFVGAGFVGWGAYSYGKREDEVARIKDTSIKVKDIQEIYAQLFNNLNRMMGGKLDEATAEKLGLKRAAFQEAFKKALLIQFAKDNGLYITDEELAKTIQSFKEFQKNGKFDKETYITLLKREGLTPKMFEDRIRDSLLIQKISKALLLPPSKTMQTTMADILLQKDRVSLKIITSPTITFNDDELISFWKKHKDNYKSELSFDIGVYYLPLNVKLSEDEIKNYYNEHKENYTDKDGKILPFKEVKEEVKKDLSAKRSKKDAILTMKKLKHNELNFTIYKKVSLSNQILSNDLMQKLITKKFLKPILTSKGWLIAKLFKENQPITLSYQEAKELVKKDFLIQKRKEYLIDIANKTITNSFEAEDIGFIGRNDVTKLKNMSVEEATTFIMALFNSKKPINFVLLPNDKNPTKVVIFKITEQKLLKDYSKYKDVVFSYSEKLKTGELNNNLLKVLEKIYQSDIKVFMKI